MISRIRGKLTHCKDLEAVIEIGGFSYSLTVPLFVQERLTKSQNLEVELVTYHYLSIDQSKAIPVIIGFMDEMERDFFEKFISVSGVGPKAAVKAFSKPIASIARAIEEGDEAFLQTLDGIGKQRAKQIIAYLQGKVGRFALLKEDLPKKEPIKKELAQDAKQVLRRLQYNTKEADDMIVKALQAKPSIENLEDLLNEIYRQRK